jgi:hypothetical protein
MTGKPVLVNRSSGCSTPPPSREVRGRQAKRSWPDRTLALKALAWASSSWGRVELRRDRISTSVLSTKAAKQPWSHRSMCLANRRLMSRDRRTPGVVCRTVAANTRGLSEFHRRSLAPRNSWVRRTKNACRQCLSVLRIGWARAGPSAANAIAIAGHRCSRRRGVGHRSRERGRRRRHPTCDRLG